MNDAVTHELQVRFPAPGAEGAAVKRRVLAWLAAQGVTSLVEGVIDGIEDALGDGGADDAFGADDRAPVLVFDEDGDALAALASALTGEFGASLELRRAVLPVEAWSEAWDEATEMIVTARFAVVPEGAVAPDGRTPLVIAPGTAFGSGRHATTKVCLEALESLPEGAGRRSFLDVGTGTGILAIAAAHLGFTTLVGTDIDPDVLAEAAENAARNRVGLELHDAAEPPGDGRRYDLVAANILAPVLHQLLPRLVECLTPTGSLLLAGFIGKEASPLLALAAAHGLVLTTRHECRGWVGLLLSRPAARSLSREPASGAAPA